MIRLFKTFVHYLIMYDCYSYYVNSHSKVIESIGHDYKNRLDFAIKNTKVWWKHRDQYSKKCFKVNGDCEKCKSKHCWEF